MPIRKLGTVWLKRRTPAGVLPVDGKYFVSKYYDADESWKKVDGWWFQFSESTISNNPEHNVYLLAQKAKGLDDFHCLVVPCTFLQENKDRIGYRSEADKYSIIFSVDFIDIRGSGKVDFSSFLS